MIPAAPELFTLIDSVTYTWHDEYVIDSETPLTPAQTVLTDKVIADVDNAVCAFDEDDTCLSETTPRVGFQLVGDRDESQVFHAFYVSDTRAICCECAHLQGVALSC
jgi:hypothetical protein